MKFRLIIVFCLIHGLVCASESIEGRNYSGHPAILINGTVTNAFPPNLLANTIGPSDSSWMGNLYVKNYSFNYSELGDGGYNQNMLECIIYIQPGDSVQVTDVTGQLNQVFYAPDTVYESEWTTDCTIELEDDYTIIIRYLSGDLEQQYLAQFFSNRQNVIYPNPTSGIINFYPSVSNTVKVFNTMGCELLQKDFGTYQGLQFNTVDLGVLPKGIYLVEYSVNEIRVTEKVIKM